MATISRMIPKGVKLSTPCISFRNTARIGKLVRDNFMTTRRSSLSSRRIGRVLNAMILRRLQPTNGTEYSRLFDEKVSKLSAVVPAALNELIKGVPLNGDLNIQGEQVKVSTFDADSSQIMLYVKGDIFNFDLDIMKTFAQAQGMLMVAVDPLLPFVQISVSVRYNKDVAPKATIPHELGVSVSKVSIELVGARSVAKITPLPDVDKIAISGEPEDLGAVEDVPVDGKVFVDIQESTFIPYDKMSYHFSGNDDSISTLSKALGVITPIVTLVNVIDQIDWLDEYLTTKSAVFYEDVSDEDLLVTNAFNKFVSDFSYQGNKTRDESKGVVGFNRYKSQLETPLPSMGLEPLADSPLAAPESAQTGDYTQVPTAEPSGKGKKGGLLSAAVRPNSPIGGRRGQNNNPVPGRRPTKQRAIAVSDLSSKQKGELRSLLTSFLRK